MVFQKPNPFPTMSIFDNVVAGLQAHTGITQSRTWRSVVEQALRQAALWDEVKDKLAPVGRQRSPAGSSSACASPAPWPWSPRSC